MPGLVLFHDYNNCLDICVYYSSTAEDSTFLGYYILLTVKIFMDVLGDSVFFTFSVKTGALYREDRGTKILRNVSYYLLYQSKISISPKALNL